MTDKKPIRENRYRDRVHTAKLSFAEYNGERHTVLDLSLSGAFISVKKPAAKGDEVPLKVWLGTSETIEVRAVVRRSEEESGMGVEFLDMDEESFGRLRRFLSGARRNVPAK